MPIPSPLDALTRTLAVHRRLSPTDQAAIRALPITVRTVEASGYLLREGDAPTACPVLISGFAYRQRTTDDGRHQILSIHIPGDALDLQGLFMDVADHSVQMMTRGQVAFVARQPLQQLMQSNAAIAEALLAFLLVEASIFREWILNIGQRDARARVAHLLCEFAARMKARGLAPDDLCVLPIMQEQLADATGMTPVHVNRTLKAMEAEGLVQRDRGAISFRPNARLQELAGFNDRYLHLGGAGQGAKAALTRT